MKIAINGLSARFGGGAAYLRNLLEHLSKIDHENEYIVFSNPETADSLRTDAANFNIVVPGFPGRAIVRRTVWEQLILPVLIKRYGVDVLFSPGGIAPVIVPDRCKQLNLVQNMAPFCDELLKSYPLGKRKIRFLILRKLYPLFAARADANIFISMDGLNTFQHIVGLRRKESKVIYHGRNGLFRPVPPDAAADFVRIQYGISERFVLYVSNIARYKKQLEVVRAYHIIRERIANLHTGCEDSLLKVRKLLFAGILVEPSYYREILALADRLAIGDEITYLGQVPQDHLLYLYSAASVFVFASICENCPNILIEAMACGAPIVSSNLGPMPEICGNAALYFDPSKPAEIADKIWQVLTDEESRQELIKNAQENTRQFAWQETARKTLEMFEELAGHNYPSEV